MRPFPPTKTRRGGVLFELIGSAALLGAVLVLITRVSVAMDTQARLASHRELASRTLQNVMEEFATLPPAVRVAHAAAPLTLDAEASRRLAAARLTADVTDETNPDDGQPDAPPSQRVTLRLAWESTPGAGETSLALTAYFYPNEQPPTL